ncbi:MAG: tryptophan-rich sensory protein [Bacteroidales bacterium]|jgi:hypothetical protein|nr:tryptophan-rich sensory protein [Bacteroidales bacterium]
MLRYINILFLTGMVVMNYLANALPINNKTTGQLSDALPNLFVPAGITFSIWGVIYLLVAAFCIWQFSPAGRTTATGIGWLFALSCLFNGLWIVAWHYEKLPLSLLIMAGLLITLILINNGIRTLPAGIPKAAFGVYLGWICIATIANVTAILVSLKWNGFGLPEQTWTILLIAIGTAIVSLSIIRLSNPYIGLAVIWAFTGIIIKRTDDYRLIAMAALVAIAVVAVFTFREFVPSLKR